MGAAILDLARTFHAHGGSCHQGGFRREDYRVLLMFAMEILLCGLIWE